jgi:hypothetical protein
MYPPKGPLSFDINRTTQYFRKGVPGPVNSSVRREILSDGARATNRSGYAPRSNWKFPTSFNRGGIVMSKPDGIIHTKTSSDLSYYLYTGMTYPMSTLKLRLSPKFGTIGSPRTDPNLIARAETECRLKIADSDINVGVAIAEMKQTLGGIGENATRLFTAFRAFKRGRPLEGLKALRVSGGKRPLSKDAASQWLEYSFAWKPLLADIEGAYKALQKGMTKSPLLFNVVRNVQFGDALSVSPSSNESGRISAQGIIGSKVKLWYYIDDPVLHLLTSLGLTNPATIVWEKVPFSFVVDWFLPIGNVLDSLTATLGCSFHAGFRTDFVKATGIVELAGYSYSPNESSSSQSFSLQSYKRTRYYSFPLPRPYIKSPFSGAHIASAVALVRQLASKR